MTKLIAWVDIPTENFERAVEFYSRILRIELNGIDCGNEKMACFPGGEGAISFSPGYKPGKDGVLVSFNIGDDLDGAIKRVNDSGGAIVQPKTKIDADGLGYFAVFIDTEGNKVGLYGDN